MLRNEDRQNVYLTGRIFEIALSRKRANSVTGLIQKDLPCKLLSLFLIDKAWRGESFKYNSRGSVCQDAPPTHPLTHKAGRPSPRSHMPSLGQGSVFACCSRKIGNKTLVSLLQEVLLGPSCSTAPGTDLFFAVLCGIANVQMPSDVCPERIVTL